ncbi:MAG: hypothetical protein ABII90_00620 [Bacteroidota bacterium]
MQAKNNISNNNEDLKDLSPTLSKIEKHNPFKIPKGYFDSLPTIIQNRCIEIEKGKPIRGLWLQNIFTPVIQKLTLLNLKIAIPVSTAIVIIIAGIYFFTSLTTSLQIENGASLLSFNQLSGEEIASVLENDNGYYIDEYLIIEALLDKEMEEEENAASNPDNIDDSSDEIIDYLIENDIDLSTIVNEM